MRPAELLDTARENLSTRLEGARRAFENLNEREKKLVTIMGAVLALIVVLLPIYLLTSSISDLEQRNREIAAIIKDLSRAKPAIRAKEAERRASERLYETAAPPLGSFLEAKAREQNITIRELTDQPEKSVGSFRRRHVRAVLGSVGLAPVVRMLAAIENSPYPVALERIHIDHFQSGDVYTVQIGVIAYDRRKPDESSARTGTANAQSALSSP